MVLSVCNYAVWFIVRNGSIGLQLCCLVCSQKWFYRFAIMLSGLYSGMVLSVCNYAVWFIVRNGSIGLQLCCLVYSQEWFYRFAIMLSTILLLLPYFQELFLVINITSKTETDFRIVKYFM